MRREHWGRGSPPGNRLERLNGDRAAQYSSLHASFKNGMRPMLNDTSNSGRPLITLTLRMILAGGCLLGVTAPACWADDVAPAPDQVVMAHREALHNDRDSPVLGDPNGDVTIVEFFDYACSYCKAIEPRLESALRSDPHVKLILKEFPILTPESLIAARASLASRHQHKYREFHQALLAYRGPWNEDAIFSTATGVGLNLDRLRHDMGTPGIANEIIENFNLARGLRIFQSPAFIVGDHILTGPSAQIDFPAVIGEARRQRHALAAHPSASGPSG
jgi:protein-disulfide isomerase